jgi:hypothetical protein
VTVEVVDTKTGEVVPIPPAERLTPEQAHDRAQWVREVKRAALVEGVDFGKIPGTGSKPALLKPGAEALLTYAGYGFSMSKIDDADAREHRGVTYKASVHDRFGFVLAECEGFAGYDESRFYRPPEDPKGEYRAPWNTVLKMAQKRALVGAALNATAASGLFVVEGDDDNDASKGRRGSGKRSSTRQSPVAPRTPAQPDAVNMGTAGLEARRDQLPNDAKVAFSRWLRSKSYPWPPADDDQLADATAEIARLEKDTADASDAYDHEPPVGSPYD